MWTLFHTKFLSIFQAFSELSSIEKYRCINWKLKRHLCCQRKGCLIPPPFDIAAVQCAALSLLPCTHKWLILSPESQNCSKQVSFSWPLLQLQGVKREEGRKGEFIPLNVNLSAYVEKKNSGLLPYTPLSSGAVQKTCKRGMSFIRPESNSVGQFFEGKEALWIYDAVKLS